MKKKISVTLLRAAQKSAKRKKYYKKVKLIVGSNNNYVGEQSNYEFKKCIYIVS